MSLPRSPRARAYGLLLANTILWGLASPIIKVALEHVSYNYFLFWRFTLAAAIYLPIYLLSHPQSTKKQSTFSANIAIISLAILGTPLTLIPLYYGLTMTSSIHASILSSTSPIITIFAGWILLKEKINHQEKLGILIAIVGTMVITFDPLIFHQNLIGSGSTWGNLLIIVSNLIWTLFLICIKKLKISPSKLSLTSYLVSIPIFLFLSLGEFRHTHAIPLLWNLPASAIFGIVYMALFGSVIAFWAYTEGQKKIEASEAAMFTYLQPIFTFPLAIFWLREPLNFTLIASCLIIAFGVYLSEKR